MEISPTIRSQRSASAVLCSDGTGVLRIDGVDEPVVANDVAEARAVVLARVSAHAANLACTVRLRATDPDGRRAELMVRGDGSVEPVGGTPFQAPARPRRIARATPAMPPRVVVLGVALMLGVALGIVGFRALRSRPVASPSQSAMTTTAPTPRRATADYGQAAVRAGADTARVAASRREAARRARRHAAAGRARAARQRAARHAAARPPASSHDRAARSAGEAQVPVTPPPVSLPAPPAAAQPPRPRITPGDLPPAQP
jgi:hypothetical protein